MERKQKVSHMRMQDIVYIEYEQVCLYLVAIQGKAIRCEPSSQTRAMKCVSARQRLTPLNINKTDGASGIILQVLRGGIWEPAYIIRAALKQMRILCVCYVRAWGRPVWEAVRG